jgi:hypothetical protein
MLAILFKSVLRDIVRTILSHHAAVANGPAGVRPTPPAVYTEGRFCCV